MKRLAVIMWFLGAGSSFAQQSCPAPVPSFYYVPSAPSFSYSYSPSVYTPTYNYSPPACPPTYSPPTGQATIRFTNIPRVARVFVDGNELGERFRLSNGSLGVYLTDVSQTTYALVRVYINVDGYRFDSSRYIAYGPGRSIYVDASEFGLQSPTTSVTPPPPDYSYNRPPVVTATRSFSPSTTATTTTTSPYSTTPTYTPAPAQSTTTYPYRESTTTYSHQSGAVLPNGDQIRGPSISIIRTTP